MKQIVQKIKDNGVFCIDERKLSIILFATFFSWLLAVPFEGQVLYAIANSYQIDPSKMIFASIAAHLMGLICGGFFVNTIKKARQLILVSIVFCIFGSSILFFAPSILWDISLISCSFLVGCCVAAWGFYFKNGSPANKRMKTAADVLIFSNILMITLNIMAIYVSPYAALVMSVLILGVALFFAFRLSSEDGKGHSRITAVAYNVPYIKPLAFLCLFIVIITVNSGLMYQVINPSFAHHQWLIIWYWAVPYIAALYLIRRLPRKSNQGYILYIAIAMIGLSFIFFIIFDRSVASYLIINTLMLGAFGINDLFWWSILGEMLNFDEHPARILGIGLSANVMGVLIGGLVGNAITATEFKYFNPSLLALFVVCIILLILPPLHIYLSKLLKDHVFLTSLSEITKEEQTNTLNNLIAHGLLTERESEVVDLLFRGRTYKMAAKELCLSENTVKYHIKNIYSKLNINSKAELIQILRIKSNS